MFLGHFLHTISFFNSDIIDVPFFNFNIYLFGCIGSQLWHTGVFDWGMQASPVVGAGASECGLRRVVAA